MQRAKHQRGGPSSLLATFGGKSHLPRLNVQGFRVSIEERPQQIMCHSNDQRLIMAKCVRVSVCVCLFRICPCIQRLALSSPHTIYAWFPTPKSAVPACLIASAGLALSRDPSKRADIVNNQHLTHCNDDILVSVNLLMANDCCPFILWLCLVSCVSWHTGSAAMTMTTIAAMTVMEENIASYFISSTRSQEDSMNPRYMFENRYLVISGPSMYRLLPASSVLYNIF